MVKRLSRRAFLALSGTSVAAIAALRAGVLSSSSGSQQRSQALIINPVDPYARPVVKLSPAPPSSSPAPLNSTAPVSERPTWSSDLLKQVVRSGPADKRLIGLTIDDGWSAQDAVLKVLTDRKVYPTLFLTGRAVKNDPQFIARAMTAGCEVGNHTMDHAWLLDKTKDYIQSDIRDFESFVRSVVPSATTMPYMRPSGGAVNQTVIDAASELGYRPVLWSASAGDSSSSTTTDQMVSNALSSAKAGSILLMHFSHRTEAALPQIIDGLRATGLEPVSLTRLFA